MTMADDRAEGTPRRTGPQTHAQSGSGAGDIDGDIDQVVPDEPLTCHLCQRPAVLEVHTTGHHVGQIDECTEPTDEGVWVCRSCHLALHRWMERNPGEGCQVRAIAGVMNQALDVIKTPRSYRRRRDAQTVSSPGESSGMEP
ncbi:hypothetical protein [Nesterenkonia sp. K-15-9-6]|uniref:hypothetical protein n=1 Tax=Nesterenkonia sp. K-15-9-6 TaxID=3093918 RepID=UPI004043A219